MKLRLNKIPLLSSFAGRAIFIHYLERERFQSKYKENK
jgi:hypothetical protein